MSLSEWDCPALWGREPRYPDGIRTAGRCRRCGCTPRRACTLPDAVLVPGVRMPCGWADDRCTLCSACWHRPERRRYRRPRLGHTAALAIRQWYAEQRAWRTDVQAAYERAQGEHRRVVVDLDGEPLTIYGDPHMDAETLAALMTIARAARRMIEGGGAG